MKKVYRNQCCRFARVMIPSRLSTLEYRVCSVRLLLAALYDGPIKVGKTNDKLKSLHAVKPGFTSRLQCGCMI